MNCIMVVSENQYYQDDTRCFRILLFPRKKMKQKPQAQNFTNTLSRLGKMKRAKIKFLLRHLGSTSVLCLFV